jgi:replicative DNA helicase
VDRRKPPTNIEAEQRLLGSLLVNSRRLDQCAGLAAAHFSEPAHAALYEAISRRGKLGAAVDPITLKPWAESILGAEEGPRFLTALAFAAVTDGLVRPYVETILDAALRRDLIDIAEQTRERALGENPADETAAWTQEALEHATAGCAVFGGVTMATATSAALLRAEAAQRGERTAQPLLSGIETLDAIWRGLHPGALDIIGARSGSGKSSLALQIARNVARTDPVGLISLEMPAPDLALFNLAALTGISADAIRLGEFGNREAERLVQAGRHLATLPIHIVDTPRLMLPDALMQMRAMRRRHGIKLFIVDHRDLFGRDPNDRDELGWYRNITQMLKVTAKSLNIPIVLLVQLSRDIERREDKKPRMSDLMYSGEADADNIILLHRDEFSSTAYFKKRRFGPVGDVRLRFDGRTFSFMQWQQ